MLLPSELNRSSLPYVSIIIPIYKDWDRLSLCLKSIRELDYPEELIEVLIINNDPEDLPPENLVFSGNVKLYTEPKVGSYAARNTGIRFSNGEILAFTDSDCVVSAGWVSCAVKMLVDCSGVPRVGGRIDVFYEKETPTVFELYDKIFNFRQETNVINSGYAVTANLFVYKRIFDEVGFFNESLLSGGDTEWGLRASACGFPIDYCREAVVLHPARSDFISISKKFRRVTGGIYKRNVDKPFANLMVVFKALLPPVRAWRDIAQFPELSSAQKISVLLIIFRLKILRVKDMLALMLGLANPPRS